MLQLSSDGGRDDLAKLQLEQATSAQSKPFVASRDPGIILASYNPVQGVAHTMSSIEGFDKIPEELATALQKGVVEMAKQHLNLFAEQMQALPASQLPIALSSSCPAVLPAWETAWLQRLGRSWGFGQAARSS